MHIHSHFSAPPDSDSGTSTGGKLLISALVGGAAAGLADRNEGVAFFVVAGLVFAAQKVPDWLDDSDSVVSVNYSPSTFRPTVMDESPSLGADLARSMLGGAAFTLFAAEINHGAAFVVASAVLLGFIRLLRAL